MTNATRIRGTNGAALGGSPPAATFSADTCDDYGTCLLGTGTSPTTGTLFTFILGANYSSTVDGQPGYVNFIITPGNLATAGLGLYVVSKTGNTIVVGCTVAPSASQASGYINFSFTTA